MIPVDSCSYDDNQYGQYFLLDAWSLPPLYDRTQFNTLAFDGSRTDKPQMAYEIYQRLLTIASSSSRAPLNVRNVPQFAPISDANSETMHKHSVSPTEQQSSTAFNSNKIFNKQDILIAAYTGCNLMYRQQKTRLEN